MRAVDADFIAEHLFLDDEYQNCSNDYNEGIKDAIKFINNAPTIEIVEHGHWIERKLYPLQDCSSFLKCRFECSRCELIVDGVFAMIRTFYKHCPYCGALMDQEVKENAELV